ncbi:MAG: ATP-binding protein [Alphaproteobacteria bacterium]|nr:ATP-binding protein [Alphaproteobacteria bacterium]
MFTRYYQLEEDLETSVFLFGARQTGKTTLLLQQFPKAVYIDLLDSVTLRKFTERPETLYEMYKDSDSRTIIIIDEIQQVPQLLNEVHRLIFRTGIHFILCGSSARKLRRKGYNTLGGRALPCHLYPLVSAEIPDFDIDRAVINGMLPAFYPAKNAYKNLAGYMDVYLRQEIKEEALVRNLSNFQRFLDAAALTDGELVNYNNIATDCGVSANTAKEYFSILEDTLLGYMVPAFMKKVKRRLVQAPKFYFFDIGVTNYLLHRKELVRGTTEYGHAFEHFVMQELIAYIGYTRNENKLSYWRTKDAVEVDAVIGNDLIGGAKLAIEIKSTEDVQNKHLKGLRTFATEHPDCRKIVVSLDRFNRKTDDNIEIVYIYDFLRMLWNGELF